MNALYFVLGVLILCIFTVDLLWTTLWVDGGAGPVTSRLMAGTWTTMRKTVPDDSRLLSLSGPLILTLGLLIWILLLWGGWALLFASTDGAIMDTISSRRIGWSELVYFTGYTIFTLGNGDFIPRGSFWQITTTVASASGMLFITLSVTYVLSVLGAVTQKRAFANNVRGLGSQSTELLEASWDGDAFRGLEVPLNTIATQLNTLTSNHKAYPILHYFYSDRVEQAPTVNIAVLDEALSLLQFGVAEEKRPTGILLQEVRSSVQSYLEVVGSAYIEPADRTPPTPELSMLRDTGIPTVSDREFDASIAELDDRRRTLLGLVESDERQWPNGEGE